MARRFGLNRLIDTGALEVALAAIVGGFAVVFAVALGKPETALLDVAAFVLLALTVRWPKSAGLALGALVASYAFLPPTWEKLGVYALCLAVLGAGLRGLRTQRRWMTLFYLPVMVFVTGTDPESRGWIFDVVGWVVVFGVLWLVGNLFVSYRRAGERAARAALLQQRLALATTLHDTAAGTLARVLREAEQAADGPEAALDHALAGARQASSELRQALAMLVVDEQDPAPAQPGAALPAEVGAGA